MLPLTIGGAREESMPVFDPEQRRRLYQYSSDHRMWFQKWLLNPVSKALLGILPARLRLSQLSQGTMRSSGFFSLSLTSSPDSTYVESKVGCGAPTSVWHSSILMISNASTQNTLNRSLMGTCCLT